MKKIVFLVGESGCGKSTFIEYCLDSYPKQFTYIRSTTTREIRENEVNGLDYNFVSDNWFNLLIKQERFIQSIEFGGNKYGTSFEQYEQDVDIGLIAVTHEGIHDIIEGLEKWPKLQDIKFEIVFWLTPDNILLSRGVDSNRIYRGDIRKEFLKSYLDGEYDGIYSTIINDNENLDSNQLFLRNDELMRSLV